MDKGLVPERATHKKIALVVLDNQAKKVFKIRSELKAKFLLELKN